MTTTFVRPIALNITSSSCSHTLDDAEKTVRGCLRKQRVAVSSMCARLRKGGPLDFFLCPPPRVPVCGYVRANAGTGEGHEQIFGKLKNQNFGKLKNHIFGTFENSYVVVAVVVVVVVTRCCYSFVFSCEQHAPTPHVTFVDTQRHIAQTRSVVGHRAAITKRETQKRRTRKRKNEMQAKVRLHRRRTER